MSCRWASATAVCTLPIARVQPLHADGGGFDRAFLNARIGPAIGLRVSSTKTGAGRSCQSAGSNDHLSTPVLAIPLDPSQLHASRRLSGQNLSHSGEKGLIGLRLMGRARTARFTEMMAAEIIIPCVLLRAFAPKRQHLRTNC